MVERRTINLEDYYDLGDKVYLAFTMDTDPLAFGWGWRIDNFTVGNPSVNTLDQVDEKGFSARVINNPAQDVIRLELINTESGKDIRYQVIDLNGRLVNQGRTINSFAGEQLEQIDVSDLAAGIYLVNVQWGNQVQAIRVVVR